MALGQSIYKYDAPDKVTGRALYPGDIHYEGLLHAKLRFTGKPHARMVRMDTSQAERVVPLDQFYVGVRRTVMRPDEMMTEIRFPSFRSTFPVHARP